jgi:8-oxo-dGTP diphosphatase
MAEPIAIAAAVIRQPDGRVLVARRAAEAHQGGLFEFPGGKARAGEALEQACRRECREELGVEVEVLGLALPPVVHDYGDRAVALHFFRCRLAPGSPAPRPLASRELRWVAPERLRDLPFPAANAALLALLAAGGC